MTSPFAPVPPRDIAKMIVDVAIGFKVQEVSANVITDRTSLDEDSRTVRIGTTVFGMYVAERLSPMTHKAVDITCDFVAARIERRREKKDKKDSEEK